MAKARTQTEAPVPASEQDTGTSDGEPVEEAAPPEPEATPESAPTVGMAGLDPEKGVIVNLKKDLKRKVGPKRQGDQLAIVFLAPNVTLNQLCDAVRSGHARIIEPKRNGVTVD